MDGSMMSANGCPKPDTFWGMESEWFLDAFQSAIDPQNSTSEGCSHQPLYRLLLSSSFYDNRGALVASFFGRSLMQTLFWTQHLPVEHIG